ncbi:Rne/Rng family ribonuclease [Bacillus piscicola]|uniref:Rne/Rng family ribonuclease n=1 Tax=Bacillus piscicola TaxID=1632684 RepID=UPI001F08D7F3|nr:Rne/Rng family ribonuclease [Bacillus piscicola]
MYELIFNTATTERRAAIKKQGKVIEIYLERPEDDRIAGSIYKGRVKDVIPGMEAAFIDIGREKNGFLHRDEIIGYKNLDEAASIKEKRSISEFITEGQEIVVQVTKEEFGDKGARLTENVAIPGMYTVYMPEGSYIGVSKRIYSESMREKWRETAKSLLEDDEGIIIRTVCEQESVAAVKQDLAFLREDWAAALEKTKNERPPALMYQDGGIVERLLREYSLSEIERIVVDHRPDLLQIKRLLRFDEAALQKVAHHRGNENIFSSEGIDKELDKALQPKVWLKSGGFLMIEHTEAMTVIDVNTGRFTGKGNLEETILKTNIEASLEIARQLRLRDISGIIVIDFIDMKKEESKRKLLSSFKQALGEDRTKTNVIGISPLGLVEMTRKKVRRSLGDTLFADCSTCRGNGRLLSAEALAYRLERLLHEHKDLETEALVVELPDRVMDWLNTQGGELVTEWQKRYPFVLFFLQQRSETIGIRFIGSKEEAEKRYKSWDNQRKEL